MFGYLQVTISFWSCTTGLDVQSEYRKYKGKALNSREAGGGKSGTGGRGIGHLGERRREGARGVVRAAALKGKASPREVLQLCSGCCRGRFPQC